ncbi:MAG: recombinase family protein [Micropepsaceae bacterium]
MSGVKAKRCAIYTRKSSEEGLDQAFNSLDAQRDACAAYVKSQVGEGWQLVGTKYDDGGFSGGNMERPALVRLLTDIDDGRVDCVVVYKIDRLTRSLADFAKIVERFEKRGVTFVSVTQSFNTTTSMGQLTLNVLLSFAQFEREVTAERIRDKFAASKAKGIFMGGNPPLGYDARDRKLMINEPEAITVRMIFNRYMELRSVGNLRCELDAKDIRTKSFVSTRGRTIGGGPWYVGPLRHILRNKVYLGLTVHKGKIYEGQHQAIVGQELFDKVQEQLDRTARSHHRRRTIEASGLLAGLIFDDKGNHMTPQWSYGRGKAKHAYYVSQALLQRRKEMAGSMPRVAAPLIEEVVLSCLRAVQREAPAERIVPGNSETLSASEKSTLSERIRKSVARVVVSAEAATIELNPGAPSPDETRLPPNAVVRRFEKLVQITIPGRLKRYGGFKRLENWNRQDWTSHTGRIDGPLTMALARAHAWREAIERGTVSSIDHLAREAGLDRRRVRELLRLAFLAPDIQKAILQGRQPANLSLEKLSLIGPPANWAQQRKILGLTD